MFDLFFGTTKFIFCQLRHKLAEICTLRVLSSLPICLIKDSFFLYMFTEIEYCKFCGHTGVYHGWGHQWHKRHSRCAMLERVKT